MSGYVWQAGEPAMILQWRGPDPALAAMAQAEPPVSLAAIVGPPGEAGPAFDIETANLDCGEFET